MESVGHGANRVGNLVAKMANPLVIGRVLPGNMGFQVGQKIKGMAVKTQDFAKGQVFFAQQQTRHEKQHQPIMPKAPHIIFPAEDFLPERSVCTQAVIS